MIQNMFLLKEKSVLFVEDDMITRTEIGGMLGVIFNEVYTASNGEEAMYIYEDESPDIILSDIKMPKLDGISLITKIRNSDYKTPIVLMTSFAEHDLLLNAANLSVDGYLIKPVELEKLVFTLCKAAQRVYKNEGLIVLGENIFYNSAKKELYSNGKVVVLGVKEQELLVLLLNNRHKTVTKEEIGRVLWPLDAICSSAIKNIVLRLRKKLALDIIISVRGIGYRIDTCTFKE
jgi:DNA-binding response OmpR family regulator